MTEASQAVKKLSLFSRWSQGIGAAIMLLMAAVLLFLLTQATTNRSMYERNYEVLFKFNIIIAVGLLLAVAWVATRLILRLKRKHFGSLLLTKLACVFALIGIAPGVLIYVVSYQFVERSIESWFDVQVEGALASGMHLGRLSIDTLSADLDNKAKWLSPQIAESSSGSAEVHLNKWLEQLDLSDISIWDASGHLLASAGKSRFMLNPMPPTDSQMMVAKVDKTLAWVEGLDEESNANNFDSAYVKALAYIPNTSFKLKSTERYVLITRHFPANLARNVLAVGRADREYQERSLARAGLKHMYIGTLTLALILAVFGAVLLAVVFGGQMVRPLLVLAEGVSAVAAGDFRPRLALGGRDELGTLTRAFASMTHQLSDARDAVQSSMAQVSAARTQLQTILDNLTAGVILLSPTSEIRSLNPSAIEILASNLAGYVGKKLSDVPDLVKLGIEVEQSFAEFALYRMDGETIQTHWQRTIEFNDREQGTSAFDKRQTLVVRGAELPDASKLLVFDDITDIVSAQRAQAWGEVARRLAHEIKNPLTPIRLSAERLGMKLESKLEGSDKGLLERSVKMIVDQVDAMRRLVDEFKDYARLPRAQLQPLNLNELTKDLCQLYEATSHIPVLLELDENCPLILGDAQQIQQVIHNLLQNAQDASDASTHENSEFDAIIVRTQFLKEVKQVKLSVLDYGTGFSDRLLKRAFEPYVTTKQKGTGLGLAVVKKIADEHGGRVDISNRFQEGKRIGAQVAFTMRTFV